MTPEEVRQEIERRRKRAVDLRLREIAWELYYWKLRFFADWVKNEAYLILPSVASSLVINEGCVCFNYDQASWKFSYEEGKSETHNWGSRSIYDEVTSTPLTLIVEVDGLNVFSFEVTKSIEYTPEMPIFKESMGRISGFIEGEWVQSLSRLLNEVKDHAKSARAVKRAPEVRRQLTEEMKKFGL